MKKGDCLNYINGAQAASSSSEALDIMSPLDGTVISQLKLGNTEDVNLAVDSARKAFGKWSQTPIKKRMDVLLNVRNLMIRSIEELAEIITAECGKTLDESRAEVTRGIELVEYAASLQQIVGGENLEVSDGIDCKMVRYPIGVVAGIGPFNFPIMSPMWMIPLAIACGNSIIMKPSELVPLSMIRLAELFTEAGLPDGVFNVIHGSRITVEALCDHPGIDAVSFVGSSAVAKSVYTRATGNGKRAMALGGAKNHLFVMEDADLDMTAYDVVRSSMGCAGQRCMAVHAMIGVGNIQRFIDRIVEIASNIETGKDMGAIITSAAVERIEKYIDGAEKSGANVILDGRNVKVKGKENGFYVGPTLIDNVTPDMPCAREEIFGPALSIMRVDTLSEGLAIENANPYGNAASIFTSNGLTAHEFECRANAAMIGINIGIPVPREPFSFGGWNKSFYGFGDLTGTGGIEFWTRRKKITSKWFVRKARTWLD